MTFLAQLAGVLIGIAVGAKAYQLIQKGGEVERIAALEAAHPGILPDAK